MRVLITGGAGFIGSHIADGLVSAGVETAVLDSLVGGVASNVPPGVPLYRADIRDAAAVRRVFADFRPTHVSHHAAQTSVAASVRNPAYDAEVNVVGSLHVIRAAVDAGVDHFIFASSGGTVYGEGAYAQPFSEDMPLRPSTPYAAAKVAVESYLQAFARAHVLAPRILRYGNVFGPRQNAAAEAGVVAIFSRALLTGAPVRLHGRCVAGDGGCRRDYVYVDDVVSANLVALRGDLTPGVYNVGTGVGRRTEEVLRAVAEAAGVEPAIQHCEPRPGDLQEAVLSARRLEASGWRPAVDFATGIARTVHWFATEGSLSAHMPPGSCTGA